MNNPAECLKAATWALFHPPWILSSSIIWHVVYFFTSVAQCFKTNKRGALIHHENWLSGDKYFIITDNFPVKKSEPLSNKRVSLWVNQLADLKIESACRKYSERIFIDIGNTWSWIQSNLGTLKVESWRGEGAPQWIPTETMEKTVWKTFSTG